MVNQFHLIFKVAQFLVLLIVAPVLANTADQSTTYTVNATVIDRDFTPGTVLLEHDEIAGLMPAMTMPFKLEDPALKSRLNYYDQIEIEFYQENSVFVIRKAKILATAKQPVLPESASALAFHVPWNQELLNMRDKTISLAQWRDRPLLVNFIYSRCPTICPLQTTLLRGVHEKLTDQNVGNFQFLSITLDPEHDTPQILQKYAHTHQIDYANWSFATGDSDNIEQILNSFNALAIQRLDGEIDHSQLVYLVINEQDVRVYEITKNSGLEQLTKDLTSLKMGS